MWHDRFIQMHTDDIQVYVEDVHSDVAYVLNEVLLIVLGLGGGVVCLNEGVGVHEHSPD